MIIIIIEAALIIQNGQTFKCTGPAKCGPNYGEILYPRIDY